MDAETPKVAWYTQPWVKRLAAAIVGGALLASCPFWPERLRAVCAVVGDSLAGASSADAGAP